MNEKEKVVIYGIGWHAELCHYYLSTDPNLEIKAFAVEKAYLSKKSLLGLPVVSYETLSEHFPPEEYKLFIAVGGQKLNGIREKFYLDAKSKGYAFVDCIEHEALLPNDFKHGENVFIDSGSGAHPFAKVGNNVILSNSKIGHHTTIGDHVLVSSATVGAKVKVEDNVFIGINATISSNVRIGKGSFIGMRAIIAHDVPEYSVYAPKATKKRAISSKRLKI